MFKPLASWPILDIKTNPDLREWGADRGPTRYAVSRRLSGVIELDWAFGYTYALILILIVLAAVLPLVFFKWKKWL